MDKPNVFTDFHHGSLLKSFILLFERRMGGKVYRPIGMEWAEKGYWKVYDHPATQQQFLTLSQGYKPVDGTLPLNEFLADQKLVNLGIYNCYDIEGKETGEFNRAITFDAFMALPIDIIIASIPAHVEPFKKLASIHPNHPKMIYHIGNSWTIDAATAPNILASAVIDMVPPSIHFLSYHQEFDTKIFSPMSKIILQDEQTLQWPGKNIYSFVNCFGNQPHFADDWKLFQRIEKILSDWNFRSYGGQCRDGSCDGSLNLARKITDARFVWHTKNHGDGYGHVIHNIAACGRPMIVKKEYYQGKLADRLIIDGQTAIVIDGLNPEQIIEKINYYSDPLRYGDLCLNTMRNFQENINFDAEYTKINDFLQSLK